ncbi:MAG: peroxide stress protein YaaA [Actinobacteria bacterium]|nr:peroxide stress protein YaaA [Actinomycetota bacterium]
MLSVLSPAKSLDYTSPLPTRKHSQPGMLDRSEQLVDIMVRKSPGELSELMDISDELAELNAQRFADVTTPFDRRNARPAVLAFDGDVYRGMDVRTQFDERDFTEAQKTVRILSGLYGVLRPLDLMQPYRLEMGTKLETDRGGSLYDFWGDEITDVLSADLAASPGPDALINLASEEYFTAVRADAIDGRVISPRFLDARDGDYRVISFFAKRARGAMAGWLVRNRVRTLKGIRDFDGLGYRFDPERSTADEPVFLRDE